MLRLEKFLIKPLNKIVAVVISYHPEKERLKNKIQLLHQAVDHVVLVDNTELGSPWVREFEIISRESHASFTCFQPKVNLGIAAAQNLALKFIFAHFNDQDSVIFFDQDSTIPTQLPRHLANKFSQLSKVHLVGAVGPSFAHEHKGFVYWQVRWGGLGTFQRFLPDRMKSEESVCALISSGMLTSIGVLKDVGGYDDSLFIDYVDTDWCLKAQSKGYVLFVIPSEQMLHTIGGKSIRLFGRNISAHSPLRRFYMIRNSFFMMRKPYVGKLLGFSFIGRTILHHLILIVLLPDRKKQISALLKGIVNGMLNIK